MAIAKLLSRSEYTKYKAHEVAIYHGYEYLSDILKKGFEYKDYQEWYLLEHSPLYQALK